jgi:hypothetical protein
MPTVQLGNHAALYKGEVVEGERVTTIHVPEDDPHHERMRTITHADGLWPAVSAAEKPAWVTCDDPELERALAAHWDCPIGNPNATDDADEAPSIPDRPEEWGQL